MCRCASQPLKSNRCKPIIDGRNALACAVSGSRMGKYPGFFLETLRSDDKPSRTCPELGASQVNRSVDERPEPATDANVPFVLKVMRGRTHLRMQLTPARASTVYQISLVFKTAARSGRGAFQVRSIDTAKIPRKLACSPSSTCSGSYLINSARFA